jgi:hypothetical protein
MGALWPQTLALSIVAGVPTVVGRHPVGAVGVVAAVAGFGVLAGLLRLGRGWYRAQFPR